MLSWSSVCASSAAPVSGVGGGAWAGRARAIRVISSRARAGRASRGVSTRQAESLRHGGIRRRAGRSRLLAESRRPRVRSRFSFINSNVAGFADHVPLQRRVENVTPDAGRQPERWCVQRKQLEDVAMRPLSGWRARTTVSRLAEVVRAAQAELTWFERFIQSLHRDRDVVEQPVTPSPDWGVRVVHDQNEAFGPLRLAAPRQRGRTVPSIAGVARRYGLPVGKRFDVQCQGYGRLLL